jgi:putative transposase
MGFIDTMRAEGHAVESICRVLREQGCQIAARTYRSWKGQGRVVAARTVTDAHVVHVVRDIAWTTKVDADGVLVRKLSPRASTGARR